MRELGFTKDWTNQLTGKLKLKEERFTTLRLGRRDKDWEVNETVRIVMFPRQTKKKLIGVAQILSIVGFSDYYAVPESVIKRDGFESLDGFRRWWLKSHGKRSAERLYLMELNWLERLENA